MLCYTKRSSSTCGSTPGCRWSQHHYICTNSCEGPCPNFPIPPREDPVASFFAVEGGRPDLLQNVPLNKNQLKWVLFQKATNLASGEIMNIGYAPTTSWTNGTCVFTVNPAVVVDAQRVGVLSQLDPRDYVLEALQCSQRALKEKLTRFDAYLDELVSASNSDQLKSAQTAGILRLSVYDAQT